MKNKHAASLGSLGGKASAQALTPEQRTERAMKAGKARQDKRLKAIAKESKVSVATVVRESVLRK